MKASLVLSTLLGIAGAFFFVQANAGETKTEGAKCPPSTQVDATDRKTQDMLRGKTLVAAFPDQPAETSVSTDAKGVTMKRSTQHFLVYDAKSGRLEPMQAAVTCTSVCNNNGGFCSNNGCDASSFGCSSHSCFGSGCTGGSCTKTSTAEQLEPSP
jgi:hypothetical protein